MSRTALAVLVCLSLGACTKEGFLKAPEAGDEVAGKVGTFSADSHFLLEPTADAESLLGRAVHLSTSGAWTIADSRAPGCEVHVKRSPARYKKTYRIGLGDMTAMAGGYQDILRLEARYGRSVEAEFQIQNTETLTADTEGPCGEVIVKSVRVGSGFRKLMRKAEGAVKGKVGKGPIQAQGGREGLTDVADSMEWEDPQGYAFTYDRSAQTKQFDFTIKMPEKLRVGDEVEVEFHANETSYLIVYFLEESGAGTVLWPSPELPVPTVKAGQTLTLPGLEEQKLTASLREPQTPARETLVVYAFTQRDDFDRFKPQAMGEGDGLTYAAKLTEALAGLPISRWSRATVTYEILPQ